MYTVDERDTVVSLEGIPTPSAGAPLPVVVADDLRVRVAYLTPDDSGALVTFDLAKAHYFGWPNNDVVHAHPLGERGLEPYSVVEVVDSSWIRELERSNSAHPMHDPALFESLHHYVIAFHDSTFECVARGFSAEACDASLLRRLVGETELGAELRGVALDGG